MKIHHLMLQNFKNYRNAEFSFSDNLNLIRGENAQGKTNLLESLFYLSCVKPIHSKKERELICFDQKEAKISANITSYERKMVIDILIPTTSKRKIEINQIRQQRVMDYIGTLQSVLFVPDDLNMIKDGPGIRRRFLNIAISQLKPNYMHYLSNYNRTLEQKNKLLKSVNYPSSFPDLLDVYNARLSMLASHIISYRAEFIAKLSQIAEKIHYEMSKNNEKLQIVYKFDHYISSLSQAKEEIANCIYRHFCDRQRAEIESRSCLIGPHRDDLDILIDHKNAKSFASQGQIRTAVLSVKLAEREVFFEASGEYPILLFDDVLSELDTSRQNYVINKISKGQVFITSCDNLISSSVSQGKVFTIHGGTKKEEMII